MRYVHQEDSLIPEECEEEGITGKALSNMILTFLGSHELDPTKLRGHFWQSEWYRSSDHQRLSGYSASQFTPGEDRLLSYMALMVENCLLLILKSIIIIL